MESVLWYMLAGARGGPTRTRIVRALDDRPWNANQLAERLDLDYTTVRHHLDVLMEHDVVENEGGDYGSVYMLSDAAEDHRDVVVEIIEQLDDNES